MTCDLCNTTSDRTMVRGTVEYLMGHVDSNVDLEDDMTLEVTFDRVNWYEADWTGAVSMHRHWQILVGTTVPLPKNKSAAVYVRLADTPEVPIIPAGILKVS